MHLSAHTLCVCVQVVELLRPFTGQNWKFFSKRSNIYSVFWPSTQWEHFQQAAAGLLMNQEKWFEAKKSEEEPPWATPGQKDKKRFSGFSFKGSSGGATVRVRPQHLQSKPCKNWNIVSHPSNTATLTSKPWYTSGFWFFFVLLFAFFLFVVSTHLANPHRRKSNKKN